MLFSWNNKDEPEVSVWLQQYIKTKDVQAWTRLYERYKMQIFLHCQRMVQNSEDAKDLTSDTFLRAVKQIDKFDLKRPFWPWIRKIATNLCIDFIRKRKRLQIKQIEELPDQKAQNPLSLEINKELKENIIKAIRKLKRSQRRCFCLFYIHEKSYDDIVELTGYSYNEVRSYIQNGKRNFKNLLTK